MEKFLRILLCASAALLSLVACDQEQIGEMASPNDSDNKEIHFVQKSLVKEFEQGTKEGEFTVVIARNGNKGTYRVLLQKSGKNASLFSVRDTVVIPDGQYSVEVPVTVNMNAVVLGSSVSASLCIIGRDAELGDDPAYITQYSDFLDLTASFTLEWEPYMRTTEDGEQVQQTATYYYTQFYEGYQRGMLVERAKGTTNIFRLLDWGAGVNFFFKVNSDNTVVVPGQSIGYYYSGSDEYVYVSDIAQYLGDEAYYDRFPCTFDGKQTFTLNLVYYVTDGMFGYGSEKIVFAGDHDNDPVVAATYEGDGKFSFEFNSFTSSCKAVVVEGDVTGDTAELNKVYKQICLGQRDDIRTFSDNTQQWTPSVPSNTLIAVPFDAEGKPGEMIAIRFTYDPDGTIAPEVLEFSISPYSVDPYSTMVWKIRTRNAASVRYIMMDKDVLDYYEGNYPLDQILGIGSKLDADNLAASEGPDGLTLYYQGLSEGGAYRVLAEVTNRYGDKVYVTDSTVLASHADKFKAVSLDDFVGAYIVNADVKTSSSNQASTESFRVDIIKTGENMVMIKGLCNYSSYSPAITGTYIPEEHSIRVLSQNLGEFSYMNVVFGFVANLYTGIWGQASSMEFGFCDDGLLHWRTTAGSETSLTGYKFLLFDGTSYSGYAVGDKTYENILMQKL